MTVHGYTAVPLPHYGQFPNELDYQASSRSTAKPSRYYNNAPSEVSPSAYYTISSLPHPSVFEQRLKEIQEAAPLRSHCDRPGVVSWCGSTSDGVRSANVNDAGFSSWPAHAPLPPEKQSLYSELMPNIHFLRRLEEETYYDPGSTVSMSTPSAQATSPSPQTPSDIQSPHTSFITDPDSPSPPPDTPQTADGSPSPALTALKFMPTMIAVPSAEETASLPETISPSVTGPIRNVKEPRRPSLACTFCRERKIACGRPPPEAADQTCDQCVRRSFKCVYVKDRNRGRSNRQRR